MNLPVDIAISGNDERGKLTVRFGSLAELEQLCELL